jgi:hypothetical protein
MYRKAFEAAFFVSFLFLYYAVLVERKPTGIGIFETLMYVWIAAFAYDELSGIVDAGMLFYQMDFWSLWNMGIIAIGLAFVIARESFAPGTIPGPVALRRRQQVCIAVPLSLLIWARRYRWTGQRERLYHGLIIRHTVIGGFVFGSKARLQLPRRLI